MVREQRAEAGSGISLSNTHTWHEGQEDFLEEEIGSE